MTNLTRQDTRAGGRIEKWMVVAAAAALLAGCDDDRANNANTREPVAITQSGIEILSVTRRMDERTVEAVIVAGGEERQVTMEPLLDGPLPSGIVTTVTSRDGETIRRSYGWDASTGATYIREQSGQDDFELLRTPGAGRVVEQYRYNDIPLRLEFPEMSGEVYDKITSKVLRGESLDAATPGVREFAGAVEQFGEFAVQLPDRMTTSTAEGDLIGSLLTDPVFANAVTGEDVIDLSLKDNICRFFNTCAAFSCRFFGTVQICTICLAGSLACAFLDLLCAMWCAGAS